MMSAAEITTPFNPHPRRILIVLHGAIGDVLRALPLVGRIRAAWPNAHIAWSVEPKSRPVLEHHPWIDELIVYDRKYAPWSFVPFLKKVRGGNFGLVLDLQRHLKSGITSIVSGAGERYGFDASNSKEYNHLFSNHHIAAQPNMRLKLLQYQAFGDALNLPSAPIEFGLTLTDEERNRALAMIRDAPRPLLGVILGSSWPSRLYFPESTAAVIRELAHSSNGTAPLYPVLLGGPDEKDLAADVMRCLGDTPALNLAGSTTLRDLIAIFRECKAAFGPDSGPMHIAAAVGCPVVSLWGSTAVERSAPWGFDHLTISGAIPCHPCYLRKCPIGRECMRRILPEQVTAMVRRALVQSRGGA